MSQTSSFSIRSIIVNFIIIFFIIVIIDITILIIIIINIIIIFFIILIIDIIVFIIVIFDFIIFIIVIIDIINIVSAISLHPNEVIRFSMFLLHHSFFKHVTPVRLLWVCLLYLALLATIPHF